MKKIVLILLFAQLLHLSAQKNKTTFNTSFLVFDNDSNSVEQFNGMLKNLATGKSREINDASVSLEKGKYQLKLNSYGFKPYNSELEIYSDTTIILLLESSIAVQRNVTVKAIVLKDKSGFVHTKLNARQIASVNLGQDFTFLIANTASAVATSDAGTGVGYTGIRIRGSDATRINVTVNGIPINDAESHGVYWVNMPDLASSTSSVEIQRGVGSSTVGTGAFGANINIRNTELSQVPYLQLQQSYGSFNTSKSTMMFGTGKMNNFNFSGRLSKILSDGYIDRSASDLQSFQFNLNYAVNKFSINAVSFGGKERTYQSWYGTPESRVNNDVAGMNAYADRNWLSDAQRQNLLNSGRTYNYYTYENQTDNYWQNHYQLHLNYTLNKNLNISSAFFTTTGKGYYEEFKEGASFSDYGVSDVIVNTDTITSTDLVRQRWLDNVFYGNFTSFNYKRKLIELTGGISFSTYEGKHFGEVIWAEFAGPFGIGNQYYRSDSKKSELNGFLKLNYKLAKGLSMDAEVQQRQINYRGKGNDNDRTAIDYDAKFSFFNPKLALVYQLNKKANFYGSFSIGNREPVRTDFIDNPMNTVPKAENLQDLELGYIYRHKQKMFQFNLYNMQYKNQLVVTGELNDVGNALRRNVKNSYRRGIELIGQYPIIKKMSLEANLNLSDNKILDFEDVYYNYDNNTTERVFYRSTDIAFSPSVVGFFGVTDRHLKDCDVSINVKYVGKQYLDNTLNNSASLPAYLLLNFSFNKQFNFKNGSSISIKGLINNITGIFYSNNGYTYKYVYSSNLIRENFYYPQSGRNFMIGLDFKFL